MGIDTNDVIVAVGHQKFKEISQEEYE